MVKYILFLVLAGVNSMRTDESPQPWTCEFYLRQISEDYQCPEIDRFGAGSFGTVFKVNRKADNAIFVMKVIHKDRNDYEIFASRADLEVRAMQACDHPNVIQLIDHKKVFEGEKLTRVILIMEYAPDGNLKEWIAKQHDSVGPIDLKVTMKMVLQIAEGLHEIHSKRFVHRDIKPENIGLSNGVPKILDFGLACEIDQKFPTISGTPSYVDPYPFVNDRKNFPWGPASDVYSFGVTFWEMLFSRPLYYARNRDADFIRYSAIANKDFTLSEGTDETVAYLLSRMTLMDPKNRITLPEVIQEIEDYLASEVHHRIKKVTLNNQTPFERSDTNRLPINRLLSVVHAPAHTVSGSQELGDSWVNSPSHLII